MDEEKVKKMFNDYYNCNHIKVYTYVEKDDTNKKIIKYCGCIKCLLDELILDEDDSDLTEEEIVQKEFLKYPYFYSRGIQLNKEFYNLENLNNLYKGIKIQHPYVKESTIADLIDEELYMLEKRKVLKKGN